MDSTNVFNTINHLVVLHSIRCLCPSIANFLINFYRNSIGLLVDGDVILSQEGITQGDPLAIPVD